jgi:archaellum component FlaC
MVDVDRIKELIEEGMDTYSRMSFDPNLFALSIASTLRDILEDIEKEILKAE